MHEFACFFIFVFLFDFLCSFFFEGPCCVFPHPSLTIGARQCAPSAAAGGTLNKGLATFWQVWRTVTALDRTLEPTSLLASSAGTELSTGVPRSV